jgi:hypothetical protein
MISFWEESYVGQGHRGHRDKSKRRLIRRVVVAQALFLWLISEMFLCIDGQPHDDGGTATDVSANV